MILPTLRGALAAVPKAYRKPAVDAEVLALGSRLAGLPWLVADATDAQRERALAGAVDLLGEALALAQRLREVEGYRHTALTLYGALAALLGRPASELEVALASLSCRAVAESLGDVALRAFNGGEGQSVAAAERAEVALASYRAALELAVAGGELPSAEHYADLARMERECERPTGVARG